MKETDEIIGSRCQLRVSAMQLLDAVLEINSDRTGAHCTKGEILMKRHFLHTQCMGTTYSTLEQVHSYFLKADIRGIREGRFQRGRWLVAMVKVHERDLKLRDRIMYVWTKLRARYTLIHS